MSLQLLYPHNCLKCTHVWSSKTEFPSKCPNCLNYDFGVAMVRSSNHSELRGRGKRGGLKGRGKVGEREEREDAG